LGELHGISAAEPEDEAASVVGTVAQAAADVATEAGTVPADAEVEAPGTDGAPAPKVRMGPSVSTRAMQQRHAFSTEIYTDDAIGSHACSLEASRRVTNNFPLGCFLLLPVDTVISFQTMKV
jgi:hypothetical protein